MAAEYELRQSTIGPGWRALYRRDLGDVFPEWALVATLPADEVPVLRAALGEEE